MQPQAALGGRIRDAARPWAAWPPGRRLPPALQPHQRRRRPAAIAQPHSSTLSSSRSSPWQLQATAGDAQPSPPPGDPAAEAAACLAAVGVDLAQLAGEQPEAAAQLAADLALAQLLAAAMEAREGLGVNKSLKPADLAARLAFLVGKAGLPASEVQRVYLRRRDYLSFRLDTARVVLAWLQHHFSNPARLQRMAVSNPQLWSTSLPTLEASKAALQQVLGLSDVAWADAVYSQPSLLNTKPDTVRRFVDWLRSPAVGLAEPDVLRVFQRRPGLFKMNAGRLSAKLEWLLGRLQLPRGKAAAVLIRQAAPLGLTEHLLESRVAALEAYGFTAADVGTLVLASAILLSCDFDKKIRPTLEELERLLGPFASPEEARHAVVSVACKGSGLVTCTPAKLRANYDFLLAQGLSTDEAKGLLRAVPQVWEQTLGGTTMAAKLRYYEEVLSLSVRDMLLLHRAYLKEGLEKVDRRVLCMERRGQQHRLREGGTLSWASNSAATFRARYGISEEEWAASEAAWPASERAARYGLAGKQRQRGFSVDQALASARTREANSRRSREASERRGGGSS